MDAMKDFEPGRASEDGATDSWQSAAPAPEPGTPAALPPATDNDERRMQVRAYNFWSALLDGHDFPLISSLCPEDDADFGPYGVLLDFTVGIENPGISFLGEKLAEQCGVERGITGLEQVPPRSLLTRLTDHYLQIFANHAPIGFEAEFVNQRGETLLYRGIMLPFSSNGDAIDFIYGVINWKIAEVATVPDLSPPSRMALSLDTPVEDDDEDEEGTDSVNVPSPLFAGTMNARAADVAIEPISDHAPAEILLPPVDEDGMELADWLAEARTCAEEAKGSEDRSRKALYQAIGRAYDFSLAAAKAPEDYAELISDAGLAMQNRAPMTPLVKLVFGVDYDKTRLAEFATALGHAHRQGLERGTLSEFLTGANGGLKGVVAAERKLRREESGKQAQAKVEPRPALARKLREMPQQSFEALTPQGDEFALILARRLPDGEVVMLGEVPHDGPLLERAARKLVA